MNNLSTLTIHQLFGFVSPRDFMKSMVNPRLFSMKVTSLISFLSLAAAWLEVNVGVPFPVLLAFIILNIMEFLTGLGAAIYKGGKWDSVKAPRALLKTFLYVSILGVLNTFKSFEHGEGLWTLFAWTYWFLFSGISLILVRSIFENLHVMEFKEAQVIYQVLDNKYTKFLAEIAAPPSEEKKNR